MPEKSRSKIHSEDTAQIALLNKAFGEHCLKNELHDKSVDDKLGQLMPLAELIPTIKDIVENQKANNIIGTKIVKWVGIIGAIIALIWGAVKLWKEFK